MDQLAPSAASQGGDRSVMWQGTFQFASDFEYTLGLLEKIIKVWFAEDPTAAKVLRKAEEEFVLEIDTYQQQYKKISPMMKFHCICGHKNGKHLEKFYA